MGAADRATDAIFQASGSRGIIPIYISGKGQTAQLAGSKISMGAMGDSYYEYLLKEFQQNGKKETRLKDRWKLCMDEMMAQLVLKTRGGLTFIAEKEGGRLSHRMDHLTCFVGGMLLHGARILPANEVDPRWEPTGAEITRTCYEMYRRTPTGIAAEYSLFNINSDSDDMTVPNDAPHFLLRPETVESIFYFHYYTGDPKYRKWAHEIFVAIDKYCKVRFGYSAIRDVRQRRPSPSDSMESFWLAETLKYLFLTFAPRSTFSLEEFVINTEAHPLRVFS